MNQVEVNGLLYPAIAKYDIQIGDYSCADRGIEVILFADVSSLFEVSRRYETDFDYEKGEFIRTYKDEPQITKMCEISELKTNIKLDF